MTWPPQPPPGQTPPPGWGQPPAPTGWGTPGQPSPGQLTSGAPPRTGPHPGAPGFIPPGHSGYGPPARPGGPALVTARLLGSIGLLGYGWLLFFALNLIGLFTGRLSFLDDYQDLVVITLLIAALAAAMIGLVKAGRSQGGALAVLLAGLFGAVLPWLPLAFIEFHFGWFHLLPIQLGGLLVLVAGVLALTAQRTS